MNDIALESWMEKMEKEKPDVAEIPLNRLALPGTHNSGSSTVGNARNSPLLGEDSFLSKLHNTRIIGSVVHRVAAQWSKCQRGTIKDQLKIGIRYLDMRITFLDDTFHLCHGFTGEQLAPVLTDIRQFIDDHRKEIVVLDMNHVYNMGHAEHVRLIQLIELKFEGVLFQRQRALPKLGDMWHTGKRVIVLLHPHPNKKFNYENPHIQSVWFPSFIQSPWHNTTSRSHLFERLDDGLKALPGDGERLFVSQCIFTPRTRTIVKSLLLPLPGIWRNLEDMARSIRQEIIAWLTCSSAVQKHGVNIVIADYIDAEFIKAVIAINFSS